MGESSQRPAVPAGESWTRARDGTRLLLRRWPVENAKASLAIVHGYGEHSGRYDHVAASLNNVGVDVFALDLRGHGRSGGKRGHIDRFSHYFEDVDVLLDRAARESEAEKLFLLGHSMGGLIVCNYAIHRQPRCCGIIIISPFLGTAMRVHPLKILAGRIMTVLWPSLSLAMGLKPSLLSRDPSVGRAYARDPLVFNRATARWFTECLAAIRDTKDNAARVTLPGLLLQAGDDRIADPKAAKPLHDAFASTDKNYIEYPGYYHEILNEIGKEKVLADIKAWIVDRC